MSYIVDLVTQPEKVIVSRKQVDDIVSAKKEIELLKLKHSQDADPKQIHLLRVELINVIHMNDKSLKTETYEQA